MSAIAEEMTELQTKLDKLKEGAALNQLYASHHRELYDHYRDQAEACRTEAKLTDAQFQGLFEAAKAEHGSETSTKDSESQSSEKPLVNGHSEGANIAVLEETRTRKAKR